LRPGGLQKPPHVPGIGIAQRSFGIDTRFNCEGSQLKKQTAHQLGLCGTKWAGSQPLHALDDLVYGLPPFLPRNLPFLCPPKQGLCAR
jgi:hypothetical protein